MRGKSSKTTNEPSASMIYTRTYTLTVKTDSHLAHVDEQSLLEACDEAFARLQASMSSLLSQGIVSGAFTFLDHSPPLSLHWCIGSTHSMINGSVKAQTPGLGVSTFALSPQAEGISNPGSLSSAALNEEPRND